MRVAVFALAVALTGTAVEAKTISLLDGIGVTDVAYDFDTDTVSVTEDGFVYGNSGVYAGDAIDLHDDFGGLRTSTLQRIDGKAFSIQELQADLFSRLYRASNKKKEAPLFEFATPEDMLQASVEYIKDGVSTTALLYSVSQPSLWLSGLTGITQVIFSYYVPKEAYGIYYDGEGAGPGELFCNEWCGDLIVSRLVVDAPGLAAVPLPASAPLLAAGLIAVGAAKRRRNRAS